MSQPASHETPLRVAVIGAGFFSQFHFEAWQRIAGAEIVAACDLPGTDVAEKMAAQFGPFPVFHDLQRLIESVKPDLLDIVTPPAVHKTQVAIAAAAGINVICQKPISPTYAESVETVEIAEKAGIMMVIHENFRFQPWYRKIKSMIEDGDLGRLHRITFRLRPGDGQGPDAYLDRQPYFQKMERLLVQETAVHLIDTFQFLVGDIASVTAEIQRLNPVIAGEDAGYILFNFTNGISGLFDGNRLNSIPATNPRLTMGELFVEGEKGQLHVDGFARIWFHAHGTSERTEVPFTFNDYGFGGDCTFALCQHVFDHLTTGSPLENTGREYLTTLKVAEACYASSAEGRRISLR